MAVPDKRRTFDSPRPGTPSEHILSDHHDRGMYPSVEHIMQVAACIIDELKRKDSVELYKWAKANHEGGAAGHVDCHVWTDEDFFSQVDEIIRAGLWTGLTVVAKWLNSRLLRGCSRSKASATRRAMLAEIYKSTKGFDTTDLKVSRGLAQVRSLVSAESTTRRAPARLSQHTGRTQR